ncbi:MAG: hypothetical protein L3J74_14310 [Bacteroidales bacterium]|nr:hypothetical protein [Bacteroidales bacterium]
MKNLIKIELIDSKEIKELLRKINEIKKYPDFPYISAKKLAEITGLSERTLSENAKRGAYRKYKFNRLDMYHLDEVRNYIEQGVVKFYGN